MQGQGYATEGTKALIRYAFEVCSAQKVVIAHAGPNDASRRVIERCGFIPEYVVKQDYFVPDGQIYDHHYYSLFDCKHLRDFTVKWGGQL